MSERKRGAGVVPGEVVRLLEERAKIRDWLGKLRDLEADATRAVVEKVRADYRARLEGVNERLAAHREALETSLGEHAERARALRAERDDAAAAMEEAELRFRVGEYAEEEWTKRREGGEQALQDLEGRLAAAEDGVRELQRVLGELDPSRAEAAPLEPAPAGAGSDGSESTVREAMSARATSREVADDPGEERQAGTYGDELEFLESLSLEDAERFDAVSLMLEEEVADEEKGG